MFVQLYESRMFHALLSGMFRRIIKHFHDLQYKKHYGTPEADKKSKEEMKKRCLEEKAASSSRKKPAASHRFSNSSNISGRSDADFARIKRSDGNHGTEFRGNV